MNWMGIITALAVITGIYFLWSYLSGAKASPTTQERFTLPLLEKEGIKPQVKLDYDPVASIPTPEIVGNEISAIVPDESLTYETVYNIVVEAPVIPELDSTQIMTELVTEIEEAEKQPISQPTGVKDQLVLTKTNPSGGRTYSTQKAVAEIIANPITYDPNKMLSDPARSDPMDTSVKSIWIGGR